MKPVKANLKGNTFVCFHGFFSSENEFKFIEETFEGNRFIYPNLYELFDNDSTDLNSWVKNIKDYLYKVYEEVGKFTLVGYSLGGLLASISADLPFIDQIILIAPAYHYVSRDNTKYPNISSLEEFELRKNNIPVNKFTSTYTVLLNLFEDGLKNSNAKILFFQGLAETSVDYYHCQRLYQSLFNPNKQMICIGTAGTDMLQDEHSKEVIALIMMSFIE